MRASFRTQIVPAVGAGLVVLTMLLPPQQLAGVSHANEALVEADQAIEPGTARKFELKPGLEMEFVWIPAGSFQMGSSVWELGRMTGEGPQHPVTISRGFWLGKSEVTVGQFKSFVEATEYKTDAENAGFAWVLRGVRQLKAKEADWYAPGFDQASEHPVVCITWNDAKEFCKWAGVRLPTEAEWEYACRAGTATIYNFGDDQDLITDYAWFRGNAEMKAHPVGRLRSNGWGLYDMHGNVWEWCEDIWHPNYGGAPSDGSAWTTKEDPMQHILRGGCWLDAVFTIRSASRSRSAPDYASSRMGFRVVRPQD